MTRLQAGVKRGFDLVASVAGLALLWPVILCCIAIARRDTGLSGLFSQERVGRGGETFRVRKIRTMRPMPGLEALSVTADDDPRITTAGRRMRRWKLDELPQLWNVAVGDMSLVGPRPDVPGYADRLTGAERDILALRPGITGPATIKYRNEERLLAAQPDPVAFNDRVIYPDKVRLNLAYARRWSLLDDLRYLLMTAGLMTPGDALTLSDDRIGTSS